MELSDYDLRQLDKKVIHSLSPDAVQNQAVKLLDDLKDSREWLNQISQNSSRPTSSQVPWDKNASALKNTQDSSTDGLTRKAGKQPRVQGFGRTLKIPVHNHQNITHQNVSAVIEPSTQSPLKVALLIRHLWKCVGVFKNLPRLHPIFIKIGNRRGKNKIFCRISTGDAKPSPVERSRHRIPDEYLGIQYTTILNPAFENGDKKFTPLYS